MPQDECLFIPDYLFTLHHGLRFEPIIVLHGGLQRSRRLFVINMEYIY